MDTKQAQVNTFTDGLNTDLHPLTTPNTMLTDCINGAIITYNGNEYILQNDMGNYQLKKAQLPADYIPVGVKEYGNIIYIVSYNPIDKKCQIGSYPSPQTLFDNADYGSKNENYQGVEVYILNPKWRWPEDGDDTNEGIINPGNPNLSNSSSEGDKLDKTVLFTNIKPTQNIKIFFPEDADLKKTFLNPGDKYYLKKEDDEDSHWKFQRCEYYALTESKEAYKLENGQVISEPHDYTPERLKNVTWEVPGWLGYKPSLIEPSSFDLYLTDIKSPSFLISKSTTKDTDPSEAEFSFDVQGQLTISTIDDWKGQYDKLKVYFDYKFAGRSWQNDFTDDRNWISSVEEGNPTNYGNTIDILTFNISKKLPIKQSDIDTNKTIIIRATPYIIDESDNSGIVYDNLTVTYTINLSDLYNISNIEALTIYKYLSDDEGVTINFDIISPTSNLKQITCKYRIHEIQDGFTGVARNTGYEDIDSLNLLGQNILTLDYDNENGWFHKEEIYIFELGFFDIEDWNKNKQEAMPIHQVAEFLITSKLFNDYYSDYDKFQDIELNIWTSKLKKYVSVPKELTLNNNKISSENITSFAKTYVLDNILTPTFYDKTVSKNLIYDIDTNNQSDDYEQAVSTILKDENNLNRATYYGTVSTHISKLCYNINSAEILNSKGMWGNITWDNSSSFYHQTISNNTTKITSDGSISKEVKTKGSIEYNNVKTIYTNSYFTDFVSHPFSGKDGTKWYMYKNIMFGLNNKDTDINGNWRVNNFLRYFVDESKGQYPWVTSTGIDTSALKILKNKNLVSIGTPSRIVFMPYGFAQNNHRTDLRLAISNGDWNYNYSTLQLANREKFDSGRTTSSNANAVDSFISEKDIAWTFIPVAPATGNPYTSGRYWARGWKFANDFNFSEKAGSEPKNASCICILCIDGTTKSVAAINFFPSVYNEDLKGRYQTTGKRNYYSTWLVATDKTTSKEGLPLPQLNNKMSSCVSALLFGLGIHIYGFIDLKDEIRTYIQNSGNTQNIYSNSQFYIWADRNDTLKSVTYKGINILNKSFTTDGITKLFEGVGAKKYSTKNLEKSFTGVSIKTTTDKVLYNDEFSLYDISLTFGDFINLLSNSLTTLISAWTNTLGYSTDRAYSDLNGTTSIENSIKQIASSLKFEYKNGRGYFYHDGLPEVKIYSTRGDDRTTTGCLRGIDWSGIIAWEHVPELFIPTSAFKNSEGI